MSDRRQACNRRSAATGCTNAAPQEVSQHWSLAPSTWPGAETPASYPARAWRARARVQVWPAWQAYLQSLSHYDPDHVYDPGHEYEKDWTTDPTYRRDGVRLYRFDREGFLMPPGSFHSRFIDLGAPNPVPGPGAPCVPRARPALPVPAGPRPGSVDPGGRAPPAEPCRIWRSCRPSWTLSEARERTVDERIIHMNGDDPAPELVVEVVSRSTEAKDFEDNLSLYAALGIPEYLLVETGEFKTDLNMWLFRRAETDGAYHMAESGLTLTACGVPMRLLPAEVPGNVPVFQCQDPETRHWHDYEGSIAGENVGGNVGGKSTPPCRYWMPSCPPCPRPTGRASKPPGWRPACPPRPCNASCL